MTAGWCSRTVRAAVFAAVCVVLAALGHVLMSGSQVPAWTLAAGAAGTGVAGWCLAGRERGLALVVAVAVIAQTALHKAFSYAQAGTANGSTSMNSDMDMGSAHTGSMHMDAMDSMGVAHMDMSHMDHMGQTASDSMSALSSLTSLSMGGSSSFGMLAAHLLAALLSGLWLAYGERAAFRILRAVAGWLAAPLRLLLALPAPPHRPRLVVRRRRSDRAPRLLLLVHAITSRGPPLGTAVV
ncbi:hypothetical protein [Streptomyces sp. GESEQ-35]|uniref:hypothetical protein n=1 Tax=Streptomyces sp. GESEQ-35 TaxID=2812657 RepID=UPI001B32D53B|nr:hypothetical protein [Streptomyces sp. GESEQ-35]